MNRLVRELPLYTFVLAALVAALAYGTVRHLTARAAHPPRATVEAARALAEEQGHHPALLTEWGRTTVTWWMHKIKGLHRNDFIMAAKTDELYQSVGR